MKILHIITSLESGGAERCLSQLVENENENDHQILKILNRKDHYIINENKITVDTLNLSNNFNDKVKVIFLLKKYINKNKPDIIQFWLNTNFYAPLIKRCFPKIKIIISIRHSITKKYEFLDNFIFKKYFSKIDGTIFVSNHSLKQYSKTNIVFPNKCVIPNGFNLRDKNANNLNTNKRIRFVYVGRFHKIKNQDVLISGFDKFCINKNNVELHIAGKEMKESNFKNLIQQKNKNKFIWYGEVADPFELYKKCNVLILTSLAEGFPNVIGEAMSVGLPVIATNAGESYQLIQDTGFKIDITEESLVSTLQYIYDNPAIIKEKSKKAYKLIRENYSLNNIIQLYKNYYSYIGGR